jgi:hypothetical protein
MLPRAQRATPRDPRWRSRTPTSSRQQGQAQAITDLGGVKDQYGKPERGVLTDKTRIHLRSASVRTYTFFTTGFPRFLSIRGAR